MSLNGTNIVEVIEQSDTIQRGCIAKLEKVSLHSDADFYEYPFSSMSSYDLSYIDISSRQVVQKGIITRIELPNDASGITQFIVAELSVNNTARIIDLYDVEFSNGTANVSIPIDDGNLIGVYQTEKVVPYKVEYNQTGERYYSVGASPSIGLYVRQWGNDRRLILGWRLTISYMDCAYSGDAVSDLHKRICELEKNSNVVERVERLERTPYSGLNVVLLGDSITYHSGTTCDGFPYYENKGCFGWGKYFKEKAKPKTIYNYALGGARWCHLSDTGYTLNVDAATINSHSNVIYNQINRLIARHESGEQPTPDIIIIAAGTNDPDSRSVEDVDSIFSDYLNCELSSPDNTPYRCDVNQYPNQNVTSFRSVPDALRFDMELIMQKFPDAQVVLLTPFNRVRGTGIDNKATRIGDVIERCGMYLSVPVVRQDKEVGVCKMREVHELKFLSDGTHTSEYGAKAIGYYLASRIASMLRTSSF